MAIAQSQARESQRRLSQQENHQESIAKQQHDQSNNALEDDDDDERLLPSQTHRHEQPKVSSHYTYLIAVRDRQQIRDDEFNLLKSWSLCRGDGGYLMMTDGDHP